MRVVKVLNTSVVLALDDNGAEVILMGKGIGFRKSIGETLQMNEKDKIFVLRNRNISRDIIRLAAETDAVIFGVAQDTIDYAKNTYQMNLMDHIWLALTDHLAFAVRRFQESLIFPGFYSQEVKRFNPNEYDVGCFALKQIKRELSISLPESEIANIAFHFINAQKGFHFNNDNRSMMKIVRDVKEIVKYTFGISYDTDTVAYSRFMTHLQALAQRVVQAKQLTGDINDLLGSGIIEKCRLEWECAGKITDYIKQNFEFQLTEQEKLYLSIHIHRVLEENPHR